MNIEDIKLAKKKLQVDILGLVKAFEVQTGLLVTSIDLDCLRYTVSERPRTEGVTVRVELP